ncbi:MAG: TetR/AcrR family transcriptional regulator [Ilumatobacteraceae bacterium]|nr:TetR/AcrR family transcriptional regulator [Ilumatobacteraceae bacterium]
MHGTRNSKAGGPRKSTRKAQAREEDIYRAAAQIFHRKGYAATSLQDIADEVGLLKGSLYYYIDSKEDLLYGITRTIHAQASANADATRVLGGTASDRLRFLVESHVATFGKNLQLIRVFYTDYNALSAERRGLVMAERRAYEQLSRELIEEGQATGEFCLDLDARVMNNAILTMVNTVYMWYSEGQEIGVDEIARTYGSFTINGLRCPPEHDHSASPARAKRNGRGSGTR